ncbi:MAG TPA: LysM peptidoglycan-binding domain-containing protein [Thermomicrobiales bacterium]|nr:LysM peptidoglycan-binding domain-containing protein [Thermomicrobiales bacterium]
MDEREWRMRSTTDADDDSGSRSTDLPADLGAPPRPSSTPVPLIPRFGWSARFSDFPMPFPGSEPAVPVSIYPGTWEPRAAVSEPYTPPSPFPIPSAAVIVIVVAVGALLAFAGWSLFRGGDDDSPGIGVVVTPGATETVPSIIGSPPVAQTPGDGGAEEPTTGTPDDGASPAPGDAPTTTGDGEDEDPADPGVGDPEDPGSPGVDDPGVTDPSAPVEPDLASAGAVVIEAWDGDTLHDVAERWGLSVSTLIWANEIDDPGQTIETRTLIVIPHADGVLHTVVPGDTLESIAARYGVYPWDIVNIIQNGVRDDSDLYPGQLLTIPGARPASRDSVAWYTVREGDNVYTIATYYGLSAATVAYANELPTTLLIHPDQQLVIPPADGLLISVEAGDSVEAIAARFGIPADIIRSFPFNHLPGDAQPHPGDWIHIPTLDPLDMSGGKGGAEEVPVSDPFASGPADETATTGATGTFMWPTWGSITQEFHGSHNGLDIGNNAWTPIVAADGGVVTFAGWNDWGLGYAVAVDHENGFVTWYGHFAEHPAVAVGQRVAQGEWLGPMGSTGKSTGPHLHFIVMLDGVYQNPAYYLP